MKLRSRFKPIKLLGTCVNSTIPLQLLYSRSPLGFGEKGPFVRCAICIYIYTHTYLHLHTYSFFFLSKLLFFPFSPPFVFLCFFFRSMFFFVQSVPSCLSTFKLQRTIPRVFRRSNLFDQITVMVVCVNAVWIVGVDPVKLTSSRGIVSLDGFCFQLEVDLYIIYMYTQIDECFLFFIFFKCCLFFPNVVF